MGLENILDKSNKDRKMVRMQHGCEKNMLPAIELKYLNIIKQESTGERTGMEV